jgi:hypothetical protein
MKYEGMVHALEEIHRLLKPDGLCLDIHPIPEGYLIKVLQGETILFAEPRRETCSEDVIQAQQAIAQVVERGLFKIERSDEYDVLTYASSVRELRAYWDEQNSYDDRPADEAVIAREENLYDQVEEIMRNSGESSKVAIHEKAVIARLKPLRQ